MSDGQAMADQAWAAATDICSRYLLPADDGSEPDDDMRRVITALVAAGWVEGRQAGGAEAQAILRTYLEGSS